MIYKSILAKSKQLDDKIQSLQEQIAKLPKGNFYCARNGNSYTSRVWNFVSSMCVPIYAFHSKKQSFYLHKFGCSSSL